MAHPDKANRLADNKIAIDFTASVYLEPSRESTAYERVSELSENLRQLK